MSRVDPEQNRSQFCGSEDMGPCLLNIMKGVHWLNNHLPYANSELNRLDQIVKGIIALWRGADYKTHEIERSFDKAETILCEEMQHPKLGLLPLVELSMEFQRAVSSRNRATALAELKESLLHNISLARQCVSNVLADSEENHLPEPQLFVQKLKALDQELACFSDEMAGRLDRPNSLLKKALLSINDLKSRLLCKEKVLNSERKMIDGQMEPDRNEDLRQQIGFGHDIKELTLLSAWGSVQRPRKVRPVTICSEPRRSHRADSHAIPQNGKCAFDFYANDITRLIGSGKVKRRCPFHIHELKSFAVGSVKFEQDCRVTVFLELSVSELLPKLTIVCSAFTEGVQLSESISWDPSSVENFPEEYYTTGPHRLGKVMLRTNDLRIKYSITWTVVGLNKPRTKTT